MSALAVWYIHCDKKGPECWQGETGEAEEGEPGEPLYSLEETLVASGWRCSGSKHICPPCRVRSKGVNP